MAERDTDVAEKTRTRTYPEITQDEDGKVEVRQHADDELQTLYGVQTEAVGRGLFMTALNSLGEKGEHYREMISAMAAELEPRDALEAMLINQMTATNVAMSVASQKMNDAKYLNHYEVYERAFNRLGRTYLGQMEALKKYRAKAQQTVRVERVTVEEGGQAIVGDVNYRRGDNGEK